MIGKRSQYRMSNLIKFRSRLRLIDGLSLLAFTIFFIINIRFINFIMGDSSGKVLQDYLRNAQYTDQVVSTLSYSKYFLYPSFYLVFMSFITSAGVKIGFVLFVGLFFCAIIGSLYGIQKLLDRQQPGFFTAALFGLIAVGYFVQWDIRAVNINTIYLSLIIWSLVLYRSNQTAFAGILLAASIGTKLYSIVFLPWLLWTGQWRWLLWTLIGLAMVFVGIPLLWFGSDAFIITKSWIDTLVGSGKSDYLVTFGGYHTSVQSTVAVLLKRNVADETTILATRSIQAIWLILIGLYFIASWRRDTGGRTRITADAGVLVTAPLLLSAVVQPHHGAVMLLPAAVMAIIAVDPGSPKILRFSLAAVLLASFLMTQFGPKAEIRGIALVCVALLMLAGMALVRTRSD